VHATVGHGRRLPISTPLAGAWLGYKLITFRWEWTHHAYTSPRHSDVSGAFQGLVDALIAIGVGAVIGLRLVMLLTSVVRAVRQRSARPLRPSPWLALDAFALTVLAYLTYVSNFLEW
jgi:hypothetical protein